MNNDTLPLTSTTTSSSSSDKSKSKTAGIHHRTIWQSFIMMIRKNSHNKSWVFGFLLMALSMTFVLLMVLPSSKADEYQEVRVDIIGAPKPDGQQVTKEFRYSSHVTLYVEDVVNGSKTPSGWSTRVSDGANIDKPFEFEPGVGLIQGWTDGVLQMKEGERAWLHVPSKLGYGSRPMGSPGGAFYIPANSDLLFDIEILGRVDRAEL